MDLFNVQVVALQEKLGNLVQSIIVQICQRFGKHPHRSYRVSRRTMCQFMLFLMDSTVIHLEGL